MILDLYDVENDEEDIFQIARGEGMRDHGPGRVKGTVLL